MFIGFVLVCGVGWMRLNDKYYYKIKKEKFNYKYKNKFEINIL